MTLLSQQSKIGFIGSGKVAGNLAANFIEKGYVVAAVSSKNNTSARALAQRLPSIISYTSNQSVVNECDVVFVAVPDDAIASSVSGLSWAKRHGVVHCSGARTLECLDGAARQGAMVASFHPLQTFVNSIAPPTQLEGIGFAVAGDTRLVEWLQEVVISVGGIKLFIKDEMRSLYHASAVMACGLLAGLVGLAAEMWEPLGIDRDEALKRLIPLIRSTVDSLDQQGLPLAITGPFVRGDVETVKSHLGATDANSGEMGRAYAALALASLHIARQQGGITDEDYESIKTLLSPENRQ